MHPLTIAIVIQVLFLLAAAKLIADVAPQVVADWKMGGEDRQAAVVAVLLIAAVMVTVIAGQWALMLSAPWSGKM